MQVDQETKTETSTEAPKEEKENMMTKVKAAGVAGLVSYALWEFVFWTVSVPLAIYTYHSTTGEWPSFDNPESTAKVRCAQPPAAAAPGRRALPALCKQRPPQRDAPPSPAPHAAMLTRAGRRQVSAVIFGFLNVAHALVPVRIGLTLATTPAVDKYIIKPLGIGKNKEGGEA